MAPWNLGQGLEAGRGLAESLGQDGGEQAGEAGGFKEPLPQVQESVQLPASLGTGQGKGASHL